MVTRQLGGFVVGLASNLSAVASVPASFTIAAGSKTGTFPVTATPQTGNQIAVITASGKRQFSELYADDRSSNGIVGRLESDDSLGRRLLFCDLYIDWNRNLRRSHGDSNL